MGAAKPKNGQCSVVVLKWACKRPIMGATKPKNGQCSKVVLKWSCERPIMGAVKPKSGQWSKMDLKWSCERPVMGVGGITDCSIFQFIHDYVIIDATKRINWNLKP